MTPSPRPIARLLSACSPRPGAWPLAFLVLAFVLAATTLYLLNEDFWWYLACGRAILAEGGVPGRELFLYPLADQPIWLAHSWGWTALVALLESQGGLALALLPGTLAAGGLVWCVFTRARLDRFGLLNAAATFLVLWVAGRRISHKSELASWFLFAVYVALLDGRARLSWRAAIGLALGTLVWSNVHGGYLLAYALLAAYALDRSLATRARAPLRQLRAALAPSAPAPWLALALVGVLLVSPTGTILADHVPLVLGTASERGPQDLILEYQRTFSSELPPLFRSDIRFKYLLFVGLGSLGFACTRRPRSVFRVVVFAGMALLGHRAVRFVHGLGIASVLITMANLARPADWLVRLGQRIRGRASTLVHAFATLAAALSILTAGAGLWINRGAMEVGQSRDLLVTFDPEASCPGAAAFLRERGVEGPIFNDMLLGGDLIQRLWPAQQLFIDSRNMSYELLREYLSLCTDDDAWHAGQERYGFRTVVLSNLNPPGATTVLRQRLARDREWKLAYLDPQSAIFRRRPAPSGRASAAWRALEARILPLAVDGASDAAPFAGPTRTSSSGSLSLRSLAERLGRIATLDARAYIYRYMLVLDELGLNEAKWAVSTAVLAERPDDSWLRARRAEAGFALGRFAASVEDLDWLLTRQGHDYPLGQLLFLRARCYAGLDLVERALADLRALSTIQPDLEAARDLERELLRRSPSSTDG